MRVVHFRPVFSQLSETFIYDSIVELHRQGIDCHALTIKRKHRDERPFANVHVASLPLWSQMKRIWSRLLVQVGREDIRTYSWPYFRPEIERLLQQVRPDLIHAHFGTAGALIGPIVEELEVPLVVSFYGYDISSLPRSPRWRARYQRLWSTASAVAVLSRAMRQTAIELGCPASKIQIIHLAKDPKKHPFRLPSIPLRRLVSVGRLEEKKGHLDAIKAVARVHTSGVPITLEIVGSGSLQEPLRAYIQENGLASVVTLHGALHHARVLEMMSASDAFILCSKTASDGDEEGTPTVLLEAQALGLPCVTTWHSGIPEIIPEENHWLLAEPGDVDGISNNIRRLLLASNSEINQVCTRGRRKMEAEFNLEIESKKLIELYGRSTGASALVQGV
jgi:colanic acid/amylovoran biosynthesis glycosyltransferase